MHKTSNCKVNETYKVERDQFQQCAYVFFQKPHSIEGYEDKKFDAKCYERNKRLERQNWCI